MKIATSILNLDETRFEEINSSITDYLHIDIMDGIFVNNKTDFTNILTKYKINKPLDIHLMVKDVYKYVEIYSKFKPKYITFHIETNNDIKNIINFIKEKNIKVGLAISPNTDLNEIYPYLEMIDLVLIMSVEPGLGGQEFILKTYDRLEKINSLKNNNFIIEVDGGINSTNIKNITADIVVVGSYITKSKNFNETIKKLI